MKQTSIKKAVSLSGKSLHTGATVNLTLKPAPEDSGIIFRRIDLPEHPEVRPLANMTEEMIRNTTVVFGGTKLFTIEHVLSALNGLDVDNVIVEMDGEEPPIMDGSARLFVDAINEAGIVEQNKERKYFSPKYPIVVSSGDSVLAALPYNGFKVTCTSQDDRKIHTQHLSLEITPENYINEIAPCRTFTIYEDIEPLIKMGKIQGGSLDSAVVIKGDKIISKDPLRFPDEFVRHKILDLVGDIVLTGVRVKAHFVAVKTGHKLNAELSRELRNLYLKQTNE